MHLLGLGVVSRCCGRVTGGASVTKFTKLENEISQLLFFTLTSNWNVQKIDIAVSFSGLASSITYLSNKSFHLPPEYIHLDKYIFHQQQLHMVSLK